MPCATSLTTTRKYSSQLQGSIPANFTYEEETVHGNEKLSSMKLDTTSTPYSFSWEVIKAPYFYPFEGKIELTGEPISNGLKSTFKFEKNGKTIISKELESTSSRHGID